ncbi:MAG: hypothetical protein JXR48_10345 [Candidatus Delongbacteria bacterium]|nr:hypothetical protein [Candidatus Delongbacteria bacterium]MBN2835355.1 hypothetical protein [Candidatus Delongbacteria bacterium]
MTVLVKLVLLCAALVFVNCDKSSDNEDKPELRITSITSYQNHEGYIIPIGTKEYKYDENGKLYYASNEDTEGCGDIEYLKYADEDLLPDSIFFDHKTFGSIEERLSILDYDNGKISDIVTYKFDDDMNQIYLMTYSYTYNEDQLLTKFFVDTDGFTRDFVYHDQKLVERTDFNNKYRMIYENDEIMNMEDYRFVDWSKGHFVLDGKHYYSYGDNKIVEETYNLVSAETETKFQKTKYEYKGNKLTKITTYEYDDGEYKKFFWYDIYYNSSDCVTLVEIFMMNQAQTETILVSKLELTYEDGIGNYSEYYSIKNPEYNSTNMKKYFVGYQQNIRGQSIKDSEQFIFELNN